MTQTHCSFAALITQVSCVLSSVSTRSISLLPNAPSILLDRRDNLFFEALIQPLGVVVVAEVVSQDSKGKLSRARTKVAPFKPTRAFVGKVESRV